jgi:hypothetical protein
VNFLSSWRYANNFFATLTAKVSSAYKPVSLGLWSRPNGSHGLPACGTLDGVWGRLCHCTYFTELAPRSLCSFLDWFRKCTSKLAAAFTANIREPNGFLRSCNFRLTGCHGNSTNGAQEHFWRWIGHKRIWLRYGAYQLQIPVLREHSLGIRSQKRESICFSKPSNTLPRAQFRRRVHGPQLGVL